MSGFISLILVLSMFSLLESSYLTHNHNRHHTEAKPSKALIVLKDFSKLDFVPCNTFERSFDLFRNEISSSKINLDGNELMPTDLKADPKDTRQPDNQWMTFIKKLILKAFMLCFVMRFMLRVFCEVYLFFWGPERSFVLVWILRPLLNLRANDNLLITLGLAVLFLNWPCAQAQCFTSNENSPTMPKDIAKRLSNARFDFALESLHHMANIETRENIFYSPHSLYEALELAYFGSRGDTEISLHAALRLPRDFTKLDLARSYTFERSLDLLRNGNFRKNYKFRSANQLRLSSEKKLRKCMLDFFGDELRPTDFKTNYEATRERINQWVSNVTQKNIKDFLPRGNIDEETDAVLVNAVYFKGLWKSTFNPVGTRKKKFYLDQGTVTDTKFMNQGSAFNYTFSQELGAEIIQLPYKGEDLSMYILLPPFESSIRQSSKNNSTSKYPPQADGVRQLLQRISNPNGKNAKKLRSILDNGMPTQQVQIAIPKFSLECKLPIGRLLMAMAAGSVFDLDSDFSGFVEDGETGVHLGEAIHKAKIQLSEEGTTAAAATALYSSRSGGSVDPARFNANHPFVYFIYDKSSQAMLFAGIFRKPKNNIRIKFFKEINF